MTLTTSDFQRLYPDVDPARPLPPTVGEMLAIAVAAAVLAFGFASGDLMIALIGFALVLFANFVPLSTTHRRIRQEAKDRFPGENWAEFAAVKRLNVTIMVPLLWAVIGVVCLSVYFFWPASTRLWGAGAAAAIAFLLVLVMPGISPLWADKTKSLPGTVDTYVTGTVSHRVP